MRRLALLLLAAALAALPAAGCVRQAAQNTQSERPCPAVLTFASTADKVCLLGDFNGWDRDALCAPVAQGQAVFCLALPPGRYAYGFLVNGRILPDPEAQATVGDGFGGANSLLVIE